MADEKMDVITAEDEEFALEGALENAKQYMTFKSGSEYYGIELKYVNEIMGIQAITEIPEVEDYIRGLINLRGKIVPVIDVRIRFKQEPFEYNDRTCIIIVDVRNTVIGLIVETIEDVVTIKDDDIEAPPSLTSANAKNKYVYGFGKVGDEVKLLLNPEKLIRDEDISAIDEVIEENY
ncbi:MAG: purine-binding chemotaxis protein CheW [Lachnospiraceae bacterium]|nr:purine-binding chemotaxis protein CheW [Lachnospiraceae bacterium]